MSSLHIDELTYTVSWQGMVVPRLAKKEWGVLWHLTRLPGAVFTRNQLLDLVWGHDADKFDRVIDAHMKRLRIKFRTVDPDFDAIKPLYGVGYYWEERANSGRTGRTREEVQDLQELRQG